MITTTLLIVLVISIVVILHANDNTVDKTIYFIFSNHLDHKNHYEHIWTQFFSSYNTSLGMKVHVVRYEGDYASQYRYGSIDVTLIKSANIKAIDKGGDSWSKIYNYINKEMMLLMAAQKMNHGENSQDIFIFLPDSSIPLKSLSDVYDHLTKSNIENGVIKSSFCLDLFSNAMIGNSILSTTSKRINSEKAGTANIPGTPNSLTNGIDNNGYKILGEYSGYNGCTE